MKYIAVLIGLVLASQAVANESAIRDKLNEYLPELQVNSVRETPVQGMWQITAGPTVAYTSSDGEYLFQGEIVALSSTKNLTKEAKRNIRIDYLDKVPKSERIIFRANPEKHVVIVFTDLDCGYCRKFHGDIRELNRKGISVHYLAFPRTAVGTDSYDKAVSVWCSSNREKALTMAKKGKEITQVKCPSPVQDHVELGINLGVSGTPSMFLEDGRLIYGYVAPDRLEYLINLQ